MPGPSNPTVVCKIFVTLVNLSRQYDGDTFAVAVFLLTRYGTTCSALPSAGTTPTSTSKSLMPWILLVFAGLLEVAWAVGLKYTHGFTRLWPSAFTLASMIGSVWLLALAVRALPLGTAYAIWTGIGAVGAFVLGIFLFGESASAARIASVTLILAGLVGLKLSAV
ncbi:molecular chaperone [Pandoraea terrae]|uniref:Guanidinium exporter n=2 Tax=Pandoraea terrae TaxID=1537710 RepID=A0A5E4WMW3_9BURK|nr:molecular chaperone [Pandoraea terrae]